MPLREPYWSGCMETEKIVSPDKFTRQTPSFRNTVVFVLTRKVYSDYVVSLRVE